MSYKGRQLHPDEWDASGMSDEDDSGRIVLVRFGDAATVTTAGDVCARLSIPLPAFYEAMADLVAAGFLSLQPDGSYAASVEADA